MEVFQKREKLIKWKKKNWGRNCYFSGTRIYFDPICYSLYWLCRSPQPSALQTAIAVECAWQLWKLWANFLFWGGIKFIRKEGITFPRLFICLAFFFFYITCEREACIQRPLDLFIVSNINYCLAVLMLLMHLFCLHTAPTDHFIYSYRVFHLSTTVFQNLVVHLRWIRSILLVKNKLSISKGLLITRYWGVQRGERGPL